MKEWGDAVDQSSDFCEMTYVLHNLTNKIPAIKNLHLRKGAAKNFQTEMTQRRYNLGKSASEYLTALVNNGLPPSVPQQDDEVCRGDSLRRSAFADRLARPLAASCPATGKQSTSSADRKSKILGRPTTRFASRSPGMKRPRDTQGDLPWPPAPPSPEPAQTRKINAQTART